MLRDLCERSDPLFLQIVDYRRHGIASIEIVILRRPLSIQKRQTDEWTAGRTDGLIHGYKDGRTNDRIGEHNCLDERVCKM